MLTLACTQAGKEAGPSKPSVGKVGELGLVRPEHAAAIIYTRRVMFAITSTLGRAWL